MTAKPETAAPDEPLRRLVERMAACAWSCVFVCEDGVPVGVVTERDAVRVLVDDSSHQRLDAPVAQGMTRALVVARADASVAEAMSLLHERSIRHLPVVEGDGSLCGIVTQTDLLRAFVEEVEARKRELETAVAERTRELSEANERLEALSLQDGLLGIGNRRAMEFALQALHDLARRYGTPYGVVLLDVDHFKLYNDRYGHLEGDEVLRRVAATVQASVRAPDRVFRYGGEEVLVALPETGPRGAGEAGERVRAAVEAMGLDHEGSSHGIVTVSGGIGVSHPDGPPDGAPCEAGDAGPPACWEAVVEAADRALYRAKQAGRNRIAIDAHG